MAEIEATRALSAANAASKSEEAIVATAVAHMALAQAALRNLAVPSQRVAFAHFGRALTALQRQRQQRSRAIDSSSPASGSIASQMAQCHMLRARTALNMAATMQPGIFSPPLTDHENAILPHEPGALSPLITSGTPDADAVRLNLNIST